MHGRGSGTVDGERAGDTICLVETVRGHENETQGEEDCGTDRKTAARRGTV